VAELEFEVPEALRGGSYANATRTWHTAHEFTIDFIAVDAPIEEADVVRGIVTSRVRIPVTMIFDLIRALNETMTLYENAFGEIRSIEPGDPE
jgi:hypothetical protein